MMISFSVVSCLFLAACNNRQNTINNSGVGNITSASIQTMQTEISSENSAPDYPISDFTGLETINNETWYFEDGKIQYDKNGFITYNGHEFYIENGKSIDYEPCFYGTQNGRRTYMIGDSRTRQAYSCVYSDGNWKERVEADYEQQALEIWKALGSTGFYYMNDALEHISDETDNVTDVIILSGFNDLATEPIGVYDMEELYINCLNSFAYKLSEKGTHLYYVSVNPTSAELYRGDGTLYNDKIEDWNAYMKQNLDSQYISYIDSYNNVELMNSTYDGIHYQKEANIRLIQYVMSQK